VDNSAEQRLAENNLPVGDSGWVGRRLSNFLANHKGETRLI